MLVLPSVKSLTLQMLVYVGFLCSCLDSRLGPQTTSPKFNCGISDCSGSMHEILTTALPKESCFGYLFHLTRFGIPEFKSQCSSCLYNIYGPLIKQYLN